MRNKIYVSHLLTLDETLQNTIPATSSSVHAFRTELLDAIRRVYLTKRSICSDIRTSNRTRIRVFEHHKHRGDDKNTKRLKRP